ncbi:hypothetical protein [Endozoicomonas elysicola]|uniref:Uncharacterized protein n=1 Tax=Endozoicomonas elysicola TaxID=305900 RepID=A0A081KCV1_9GAMM|nr:hypothetical protein [Endozoicomonas elysicola]KEI71977.1 hypothetical protein GV64_15700 [Endozoicomonas elysicola]
MIQNSVVFLGSTASSYEFDGVNSLDLTFVEDADTVLKKTDHGDQVISIHVADRSMESIAPTRYLAPAVPFCVSFFKTGTESYHKFIDALKVFEEGPDYNQVKLNPASKRKGRLAELQRLKEQAESKGRIKCGELECLYKKILDEFKGGDEGNVQKYVNQFLSILSDFYNEEYFYKFILFLFFKILEDLKSCNDITSVQHVASSYECAEVFEIIFNTVIQSRAFKRDFVSRQLLDALGMYYMRYVVGCCTTQGNSGCFPGFYPELPVKVYLKIFSLCGRNAESYRVDYHGSMCGDRFTDDLALLDYQFGLLTRRGVKLSEVIDKVKAGCQKLRSGQMSFEETVVLFEVLHTATIKMLEADCSDFRLLECYSYFESGSDFKSELDSSAKIHKRYFQARVEENKGNFSEAEKIYRELICSPSQVPVFDRWIRCLKEMDEMELVICACNDAAEYYREKGLSRKEEYYAHKAAVLSLDLKSLDGKQFGSSNLKESDPLERDALRKAERKKAKKKSRSSMQAKLPSDGAKVCSTVHDSMCEVSRKVTQPSIDSENPPERRHTQHNDQDAAIQKNSCKPKQRPIRADAERASKSDACNYRAEMDESTIKVKSSSYYCKKLNELFEDFYFVPHRCRDDIDKLSQEAFEAFSQDIWVLHSAGWGFHLIGNEKKSAQLLLKGLHECLCNLPEIQRGLPSTISGNIEEWLGKVKTYPAIKPCSRVGLNVAAYLSSLAYVYPKHKDISDRMRSLANWLNLNRTTRKNAMAELANDAKLKVISSEQACQVRRGILRV